MPYKNKNPLANGYKVNGTSHDAAPSHGRAASCQARILELLEKKVLNATADEIAEYLDENILTVRPRVSELHKMKLIRRCGERRTNNSGRMADAWELVRH